MKYARGRGRCRHCGRILLLTRTGKLFLHGETPWEEGASIAFGASCPGGMTIEWDPPAAAIRPLAAPEASA